MNGTECRPQAPVAEGGPVGFSMGGTDGTGSRGVGGVRAASGRLKADARLFFAFLLAIPLICWTLPPEARYNEA